MAIRNLNILMIRPRPSPETIGLQHIMVVEPLELEIMAALVPQDDTVNIIDLILEKKQAYYFLDHYKPDIVCVTGYITHIPCIIDICCTAKKFNPNIITIVGGVHVECFPEDLDIPEIDFRIVRNASTNFPFLLENIRAGVHGSAPGVLSAGEKPIPDSLPDLNFSVPFPRRDLTRKYRYRYFYVFHEKVALLKTSFGCPYRCEFCFCRKITDDQYFARPLNDVIDELEQVKEKEIYIVDDDFLHSPHRVTKFLDQLEKRKIDKRYLVYGRADFVTAHPDIIHRFKKLGLRTVIIGLESFINSELLDFNKNSTAATNENAMNVLNEAGVDCYAAVIISPEWDKHDFANLREKLRKLRIKFINLQPLTPLPGTGIKVNDDELAIKRTDYPRWDLAHVSIRPVKMSLKDFYAEIISTYRSVLFRPVNMISHLKYPWRMHLKMFRGIIKINAQYQRIKKEAIAHA